MQTIPQDPDYSSITYDPSNTWDDAQQSQEQEIPEIIGAAIPEGLEDLKQLELIQKITKKYYKCVFALSNVLLKRLKLQLSKDTDIDLEGDGQMD